MDKKYLSVVLIDPYYEWLYFHMFKSAFYILWIHLPIFLWNLGSVILAQFFKIVFGILGILDLCFMLRIFSPELSFGFAKFFCKFKKFFM